MDERIRKQVEKAKAIVVDGDKTLWRGRVAEAIGARYLRKAVHERKYAVAARGIIDTIKIKISISINKENAEAEGLERLYSSLVKNSVGTEREMFDFAMDHYRTHSIPEVVEILTFAENRLKFIATIGGSTTAEAALEHYTLHDGVANTDEFDSRGKLTGVEITMTDEMSKLHSVRQMLKHYKIEMKDVVAIGDSRNDMAIMTEAGFSIASPYASLEVRKIADFDLFSASVNIPPGYKF